MKTAPIFICTLIILLTSCEAHINVEPGSGKTFCDCTDVRFNWSATDQNDEPLDDVTITTPAGDVAYGASGEYAERLCQSHVYVVKAKNSNATDEWRMNYDKIEGTREFSLEYTCDGFIPFLDGDEPNPELMSQLRVLRICNSYTHKSIRIAGSGWNLEIPAGRCVFTEESCERVQLSRFQSWNITSGPITDLRYTREDCDPRGTTVPPPGVINPGNLRLTVTVACSCTGA